VLSSAIKLNLFSNHVQPEPLLSYILCGVILDPMEPNPYAKFLDGRDPVEVIAATPARLKGLIARMPPDQLALRPPQTPWNAREIVVHVADSELVFAYRLRRTLAEDSPTVTPWDQDRWADHYAAFDFESALALFLALRRAILLLINAIPPEERRRPVTHPERGIMTFWTIVETMAGHDANHLIRLEQLAQRT